MNRRELLSALSISVGGGLLLPNALASCRSDNYEAIFFEPGQVELINEIGEVILPETPESGGAKAARVAHYLDFFAVKGLTPAHKEILRRGLPELEEYTQFMYGASFFQLDADTKHNLLAQLDGESKQLTTDPMFPHYFKLLKELIVFAYFTSEVGATEALRYEPIPGKFEGDYPYVKGEGAWAL
ncbi:MAG: gluconate 2-dehydrogenase subunit 3 family protein [Bacteroidota bacterium]